MSTGQALFSYELSRGTKPVMPYNDLATYRKKYEQYMQHDIVDTLNALNLQGLEERISTVADTGSRSKLKIVVHHWKTIARLFGTRPLEWFDFTARFQIGLPMCQLLDPALRIANSSFDLLAWLSLTPPEFAKPHRWTDEQAKNDDLLCFRPVKRADLPVSMFHPAFGRYLARIRSEESLPQDDSDARGAAISACLLLAKMGNYFDHADDRGQTFQQCLATPPFSYCNWRFAYSMVGRAHNRVQVTLDNAYFGLNDMRSQYYPVVLRVDKNEPGDPNDPYMHVVRAYQEMVAVIKDRAECPEGSWSPDATRLLENGVPVLCLCLDGPNLQVLGAFFDGTNHIIEPLGPTLSMLPDGMGASRCRARLAQVVYELCHAIRSIEDVQNTSPAHESHRFQPGVPRIYNSCRPFDSNEICPLTLVSRVSSSQNCHPFWKATWRPPGSDESESVLVRATGGPYGIEVQRALASQGYAPRLRAISEREGAPTAYVMDELRQEEWIQLGDLRISDAEAYQDARPAIRETLYRIIDFLEQEGVVHGDLRAGNIMVRLDPATRKPWISKHNFATLNLVAFDWAGRGSDVFYPYERCPTIEGLTWPGVSGGPIEVGHDRQMVNSWFDTF